MAKKHKGLMIGALVLLFVGLIGGIATPAVFFGLNMNSVTYLDTEFILESDYVGKAGLLKSPHNIMQDAENNADTRDGEMIGVINGIIDNSYGYVILDTPIKLNEDGRFELARAMTELNAEIASGANMARNSDQLAVWQKAFPNQIFPQILITTMNNGDWEFSDLIKIQEGLDQAGDNFCYGFKTISTSPHFKDRFEDDSNTQFINQLCEAKPEEMFVRKGAQYELSLPDVEIAEYKRYEIVCTEQEICKPNYGVQSVTSDDMYCWDDTMCNYVPLENPEKIIHGTLAFSNLDIIFKEKAGDVVIAVNPTAIEEVTSIDGRFDFDQYAFQVDHEGAISERDFTEQTVGFIVLSNSEALIEASNGLIEESSEIDNLWSGLKTGGLFRSPSYMGMILITGMMWGLAILGLLGLAGVMILRK